MTAKKPRPLVLIPALTLHGICWALTWRDLSRRTDAAVRGPRNLWRVASALNTLGSVAYWTVGRRRS